MKIQFGEKGEVPWDVLLEAVQNEQRQQESEQFQNRKSLCSRIRKRCCDSWLTLAILVSVVLAAQAWVLLYFTMGCASVYKLGCDYSDEAWVLLSLRWLSKLRVSPDPVLIEGNITVDLNSYLGVNVDAPISADVKVERRLAGLGGWRCHALLVLGHVTMKMCASWFHFLLLSLVQTHSLGSNCHADVHSQRDIML
ncbi:hypothetical protein C7M84_009709 [Penaeus vannamei]|uniref:Uncharacterized protein n=1 Tax=Penaeus vannamei TaxID=6689 RepID=A0A423T601_PENVA|nr:hypothetical protein C7M84_009709 [Penaeus vannamei]